MYAVVTTGGKQYRVEPGSELTVERLAGEAGASITFDRVLLVGDGEAVTVGTPTVAGATVSGTVLGEELGPKLVIFKFKQKVKYRRTTGHRQRLTRVRIDEISAGGKKTKSEATKSEATTPAETESKPKASSRTKATPDASATAEGAKAEKPKRTRKAAADATSDTAAEKPKRTRKPAAEKASADKDGEE